MGECEDGHGSPSLETQNEIDLGSSSNGTHHDVVEEEDDDDHQNHNQEQNQDQNQPLEEEEPTIDEKLESLKLQGNGCITNVGKEGEREEKEEGKGKANDYPLRPNAVNCTFYVKTGTCKFGLNCRFNHPPKRVFQAVGEKDKGIEESNGLVPDTGKIECKYFSMPGGCKYGDACRYNHSGKKIETNDTGLNFLGLPLRPLEKECTFYMRNGSCGYGANCRFHHPNPTAAQESDGNSLINGHSLRGDNSSPKTYGQSQSFGVLPGIGTSPEQSNGVNMRNTLPYAPSMISYLQGMPQNPGWNQNQVNMSLLINRPPLPHQIVNNFSKTIDPSAHYEHLMQIEEFPDRPGQPNCDYYMKTGDCKYRSACRYNHPLNIAPKIRLPPLSAKGSYSKSETVLPVTTEIPNSNKSDMRRNGVPSTHHQQMQNGEFPERHGQPECEYFMKTGNCKFRSECRYHHPRNRVSTSSPCALNEKGLPLRPGGRVCRNYEQQGTCKYGRNCLFHHPDDSSPTTPAVAPQEHGSTDDVVAADSEIPASNNAESDWGDGWAM